MKTKLRGSRTGRSGCVGGGEPARHLTFALLLTLSMAAVSFSQPESAEAQSLLGAGGLGLLVEPMSARARGMGGAGIGLFGSGLAPEDPAMALGVVLPTVTATYQPTWTTFTFEGAEDAVTTSRFPLLGITYPVSQVGGVASLSFESFLDQNWAVIEESTVSLGTEDVVITDRFRSDGGVSVLRLGWAQGVTDGLAIGVSGGIYLGEVRRIVSRTFDSTSVAVPVQPFQAGGKWRFTGPTVTVGAHWDLSDLLRVAGSVDWSGSLHGKPVEGTEGPSEDIDIPTVFRLGASGALSPTLTATAGFSYADWSSAAEGLNESEPAGEVWGVGGGLEWDGTTLLGRSFPLRIGYRTTGLPFQFAGEDPTESVLGLGLGLNLLEADDIPLAAIDIAVEMGDREAGAFSESFTRATISVRVSSN